MGVCHGLSPAARVSVASGAVVWGEVSLLLWNIHWRSRNTSVVSSRRGHWETRMWRRGPGAVDQGGPVRFKGQDREGCDASVCHQGLVVHQVRRTPWVPTCARCLGEGQARLLGFTRLHQLPGRENRCTVGNSQ